MVIALTAPDLDELSSVVARYCDRPSESCAEGELTDLLCRKRALINRLELDFAREAARFAAIHDENEHGNPSPISWMREHCRMTSSAAMAAICVGDQAARLERSTAALAEGRLGFAHLSLMASTASAIEQSPSATARFDEAALLAQAQAVQVVRFREICAHLRHEADRDAFLAAQLEQR
ncbi:MAG: hypothetical protein WAL84_07620, partial [Candidatus Dormiibacterota bacterium]